MLRKLCVVAKMLEACHINNSNADSARLFCQKQPHSDPNGM